MPSRSTKVKHSKGGHLKASEDELTVRFDQDVQVNI